MPGDKRREAKAAAKVRAQAAARLRGEVIERERRRLQDVATLLTGRLGSGSGLGLRPARP